MSQDVLYFGSYATADRPGIYAFTFDDEMGELKALGSFSGIFNPAFINLHPNGRWLYAVGETNERDDGVPGAVWALRITDRPQILQVINHRASGGDWPCHLAIDATGGWVLVSNYGSGTVSAFPIMEGGTLGEMADLVRHRGSGPNPERQAGPHAHSALFAPDNRFAIVADLGIDQVLVYAFDPSSGRLTPHAQAKTRPGAGPRHMAFHPGGHLLYVANELDSTVALYDYNAARGDLREREVVETLPPSAPENWIADIHLSPSGDRLYVSNRGHQSVAVFSIEVDGRLSRIAIRPCGGHWPRNFAVSPGGRFLLVANQYSDDVSVLPVLASSVALGEPLTRVSIPEASCVQFKPST